MVIVISESHWQELKRVKMSLRTAGQCKGKGKLLEFPVLVGAFKDGFVWHLLKNRGKRKMEL